MEGPDILGADIGGPPTGGADIGGGPDTGGTIKGGVLGIGGPTGADIGGPPAVMGGADTEAPVTGVRGIGAILMGGAVAGGWGVATT